MGNAGHEIDAQCCSLFHAGSYRLSHSLSCTREKENGLSSSTGVSSIASPLSRVRGVTAAAAAAAVMGGCGVGGGHQNLRLAARKVWTPEDPRAVAAAAADSSSM